MKEQKKVVVANQPSWLLENDSISCYVTELGGHMAPVVFEKNSINPIRPYFISPWQNEELALDEPVLVPLRGDFFCLPFGEHNDYQGEHHAVHGEPAGSPWTFVELASHADLRELHLTQANSQRKGSVEKRMWLKDGQSVVYIQHTVNGFAGKTTLGHHATLHGEQTWLISTAPIQFGMVTPDMAPHTNREYISLLPGARFTDLREVPTLWKNVETSDCSIFPNRLGFVDIAQVYFQPRTQPAWTCAVNQEQGYVWFTLKDMKVLPSMVLWMENHGRHGNPWNGRNCCIGLEDVCAYFAQGLAPSAEANPVNLAGIPTTHTLSEDVPFAVNYIEGAARIPAGFGKVADVQFGSGEVTFVDETGMSFSTKVEHDFIFTGIVR